LYSEGTSDEHDDAPSGQIHAKTTPHDWHRDYSAVDCIWVLWLECLDAPIHYHRSLEAKDSGRGVQLAGFLGSKGEYNADGKFTFLLQDSGGQKIPVIELTQAIEFRTGSEHRGDWGITMSKQAISWLKVCWSSVHRNIKSN
jgi:hypothetical protein